MDFLENIDKSYYYIVFGIIFIVGHIIVKRKNDLKLSLKYYLYSYGLVIFLFSLSIPHISPGYPFDISDLENKGMLLHRLQRHNEALAKTTEMIHRMAFITFLFLAIIVGNVIQHLEIDKTKTIES